MTPDVHVLQAATGTLPNTDAVAAPKMGSTSVNALQGKISIPH